MDLRDLESMLNRMGQELEEVQIREGLARDKNNLMEGERQRTRIWSSIVGSFMMHLRQPKAITCKGNARPQMALSELNHLSKY